VFHVFTYSQAFVLHWTELNWKMTCCVAEPDKNQTF